MPQFDQIVMEAIKLGLAGIIGGLIGARANDRLVRKRERAAGISARRREFLAFMKSWKHEIQRRYLVIGGWEHHHSAFSDSVSSFIHLAELIRNDIPPKHREGFGALTKAVIGERNHTTSHAQGNEKTVKAIDDIIAFVEAYIAS